MSQDYDRDVAWGSVYVDGFLVVLPVHIGEADAEQGISEESVLPGQPGGFFHRPLAPETDPGGQIDPMKAAGVRTEWYGNQLLTLALSDPRLIALLGEHPEGTSGLYGGDDSSISVVVVRGDTKKVIVGTQGSTVPAVRAPELLQWIDSTEALLTTMSAATMPPTTAAVNAWKAAAVALKQALQAQLVEVT